jgi:hypothetical protein
MEQELVKRIDVLEAKIDAVFVSAEKTRKYFMWTLIITFVLFVLPLVGLVFAIPMFIGSYISGFEGLI